MKKRLFTLVALLLTVGLAVPACGGDDDDNQGDDDDNSGSGGGGTGGGGTGGGGTGGGGTGGGGKGGGGTGGSGGGGTGGGAGDGGSGGGGQVGLDEGELTFSGGDIDETRQLFPFGVAVANDGTVFVSTLGNRDNEPSRIYRFNAGDTSGPEILFEVGNAADAAVYGLGFARGKLYACISDHLQGGGGILASIYEFDSGQLKQSNLGPNNVKNNQLRSTAVNLNNDGFVVANAQEAGRCGQFAIDQDGIVYAPDVSGNTDFIYRFDPQGTQNQPGGQIGDQVDENTLSNLKMSAWFEDPQLVGVQFGTSGITFDGSVLQLFLENDGAELFSLRPSGLAPEGELEKKNINQALAAPFGVASIDTQTFVASDLGNDQLVILSDNQGAFDASVDLETDDDNSFLQPTQVVVVDDVYVVVASQLNQLGADQAENAKVFIRKY